MEEKTRPSESKGQRIESLGWLTESSIMPKKQKTIEGVGASSIVELRAQLYRTQEDAKRIKEGDPDVVLHRSRKKVDSFSKKNSGVEERSNRDKLQFKAENDGSASYAALEKKAQIYEKLVRGEVSDDECCERYNVDFLRKGFLEDEFKELESTGKEHVFESDRDNGPPETATRAGIGWGTDKVSGLSQEHKLLVREVNEETIEAREQAMLLKQRRQIQAQKNREKLKQAFLRKKLEKLKNSESKQKDSEVVNHPETVQHNEEVS